jgi:GTPase SAR1 family protein
MVRIIQLVMGPAGSGKSTYCAEAAKHLQTLRREVHLVNMDPAAEMLTFVPEVDIRELVKLSDVTSFDNETGEVGLGPNGGLVFCIEHLVDHIQWLHDTLMEVNMSDDAYFIVDFPGQIELYTHVQAMQSIVKNLLGWNYRVAGVFVIDACMVSTDASKYLSGILLATSAMIHLSIPWLNVLSKMDLVANTRTARMATEGINEDEDTELQAQEEEGLWYEGGVSEKLCRVDLSWVRESFMNKAQKNNINNTKPSSNKKLDTKWHRLNSALCDMIEDYSLVRFFPLNSYDPESIGTIVAQFDDLVQYDEDIEPKEPRDEEDEEQQQQQQ